MASLQWTLEEGLTPVSPQAEIRTQGTASLRMGDCGGAHSRESAGRMIMEELDAGERVSHNFWRDSCSTELRSVP